MMEIMQMYAREVVFVHILSAIIWVGGMIALKIAVAPSIKSIQDGQIKLSKTLEITHRFYALVAVFILLNVFTAVIMIVGLNLKSSFPMLIIAKESIWTVMLLVFSFMFVSRKKASKLFSKNDFDGARKIMLRNDKIMSINIFLGVASLYLGVILRGY